MTNTELTNLERVLLHKLADIVQYAETLEQAKSLATDALEIAQMANDARTNDNHPMITVNS